MLRLQQLARVLGVQVERWPAGDLEHDDVFAGHGGKADVATLAAAGGDFNRLRDRADWRLQPRAAACGGVPPLAWHDEGEG